MIFGENPYGAARYAYGPNSLIPNSEALKRQKAEDKINEYWRRPDNGKRATVYLLLAKESRMYDCVTCPGGMIYLEAGELWKVGKSQDSDKRYSITSYEKRNFNKIDVFSGPEFKALATEKAILLMYWWKEENRYRSGENGGRRFLPPGNLQYK